VVLGAADPQKINCQHSDPQKALPWTKPRRLSNRALKSYIYIYIHIYIYAKNAHWCYISPVRGSVVSQLIAKEFGTLIELTYVINFAKFGVDR